MGLEKCPSPDDPEAWANRMYPYCPSIGAALLFTIIFSLIFIAHVTQAIMHRKRFCWVIAMAAAWEAIGWGMRAGSTMHQDASKPLDINLSIISTVFVLIAPIWLNAFIYMTFGRMVYFFLPEKKVWKISARWLTLFFVLLDITAFIIQVVGALMLSAQDAPKTTIDTGLHTYMFGVGFQEAFILGFVGLSIIFYHEAHKWPIYREQSPQKLLYVLWISLFLISIRIFYRIGEYSAGFDGYGATHEWLMYVWDALPMSVAMLLFNLYHPAKALVGPDSEFPKLTRAMKREQKAAKKEERRTRKEAKRGGLKLNDMTSSPERMV